MSPEPEFGSFLRSIIETLETLGLSYMIGGSVASSIYGEALDPSTPTSQEQEALERRRRQIYDESTGAEAALYSPEDVIVYKLQYYLQGRMPKHLRDIGAMLVVQDDALDYDYIARWAEQIGAMGIWAELLAEYWRRQST